MLGKPLVLGVLAQQLQRFEDRQSGARERDELLIEDHKLLEVQAPASLLNGL